MSESENQNRASVTAGAAVPLVSVVMPVYNARASLPGAVQSVLRQSISNFEIIIVDDASSDDSAAVAESLAAQDSRITVYRQPWNRGQAAARNLAMEHARGTWIALLDADDEMTEHRLRTLSQIGERSGADLIADGVQFEGPRKPGTPSRLRACDTLNGDVETLSLESLIFSDIPLNGICSFGYLKPLIRRSFLTRSGLRYDEDLRFAEDLNFYVRALVEGGRFVLYPRIYYVYHQTPVSASRDLHVLPGMADHALVNNARMRELIDGQGGDALRALLDEHEQRWSTVLWFNRLKLAMRNRRISDLMQATLDCPSRPRDVLRFARDRVRVKRREEDATSM